MKFTSKIKFIYLPLLVMAISIPYTAYAKLPPGSQVAPSHTPDTTEKKPEQTSGSSSSDQPSDSKNKSLQTLPLEENFKDDKYENWTPRENDVKEIFDKSYLGP